MVARMTIKRHICFENRTWQFGDTLDCQGCWRALEASVNFKFPGAPEPYEADASAPGSPFYRPDTGRAVPAEDPDDEDGHA